VDSFPRRFATGGPSVSTITNSDFQLVGRSVAPAPMDGDRDLRCYVKAAKVKAHRRNRHFAGNQSGKHKVVVMVRERGGNSSAPSSVRKAKRFIHSRTEREGTTVHAR
jgi:hypothetical protein